MRHFSLLFHFPSNFFFSFSRVGWHKENLRKMNSKVFVQASTFFIEFVILFRVETNRFAFVVVVVVGFFHISLLRLLFVVYTIVFAANIDRSNVLYLGNRKAEYFRRYQTHFFSETIARNVLTLVVHTRRRKNKALIVRTTRLRINVLMHYSFIKAHIQLHTLCALGTK